MPHKNVTWLLRLGGLLLFLGIAFATYQQMPMLISTMGRLIGESGFAAAAIYVVIMAAGIVVAPLSSLPLIPIAAAAWGVFLGGTLSILGWWIGALIAFKVARRIGRPALVRFLGEEKIAYWERRIPAHAGFFTVFLMRLLLPVEIPSYVLGLLPVVSFRAYAWGSLLGMTPFAYVLFAMGGALAEGDWLTLSIIAVAAAVVGYALYLLFRRITREQHTHSER
ncbi:MAG: TVP38/TMEM64 family protein [Alkalispirochaetaceae bacterium]